MIIQLRELDDPCTRADDFCIDASQVPGVGSLVTLVHPDGTSYECIIQDAKPKVWWPSCWGSDACVPDCNGCVLTEENFYSGPFKDSNIECPQCGFQTGIHVFASKQLVCRPRPGVSRIFLPLSKVLEDL